MVPKLHPKGRSFRGAAAYLLHDKNRAKTCRRVAWTETRNLVTIDPQQAWKVMASTSIDRDRIKREAGVSNAGRKSDQPVLHLTLSWHPNEKQGLTKDEMMRAAIGAVRALKAEDRQALFVCHSDEPQPHVHILLNRVSPEDGRMLTSSKEKLALSRWAQQYELERGRILCEERVLNNAARDRGEFVRSEPDRPKHIYELESVNADRPDSENVRSEQRKQDARVTSKARRLRDAHAAARAALSQEYRERQAQIRAQYIAKRQAAIGRVRDQYRPNWRALLRQHRTERTGFEANERRLLGKVQNAIRLIDLRAVVRAGERRKTISRVFAVIASAGSRLEILKQRHHAACTALARCQRSDERTAAQAVQRERDKELAQKRREFEQNQSDLRFSQRLARAAERAQWKERSSDRRAAWERRPPIEKMKVRQQTREEALRAGEAFKAQAHERKRTRTRDRDQNRSDEHER